MRLKLAFNNYVTDIKLKEKLGKLKTDNKGRDGMGKIVSDPRTHDCDSFTRVTVEVESCD